MSTSVSWLIVADEGVAKALQRRDDGELEQVDVLTDAAAHADRADLRRDAYGRRAGGDARSGASVTSAASEDEKHQEAAGFSVRVADWLAKAYRAGRFRSAKVAAAPRFLGLLRPQLSKRLPGVELQFVSADLVHENLQSLRSRFFR